MLMDQYKNKTMKQLKSLIKEYKKDMHIPPYGKLKKEELIQMLSHIFVIRNNHLQRIDTIQQQIQQPISSPIKQKKNSQPPNKSITTSMPDLTGLDNYEKKLSSIENKLLARQQHQNINNFAKRIRGKKE